MKFPDYPNSGEPLKVSWARQLLDYMRSITPQSSNRCRVNTNSNGTTFEPVFAHVKKTQSDADPGHPYKGYIVWSEPTDGSEPEIKAVRVQYGTHNGGAPKNITTDTESNEIDVSEESNVVCVEFEYDYYFAAIPGTANVVAKTPTELETPPEGRKVIQPLFTVDYGAKKIAQSVSGSQVWLRCGDANVFRMV